MKDKIKRLFLKNKNKIIRIVFFTMFFIVLGFVIFEIGTVFAVNGTTQSCTIKGDTKPRKWHAWHTINSTSSTESTFKYCLTSGVESEQNDVWDQAYFTFYVYDSKKGIRGNSSTVTLNMANKRKYTYYSNLCETVPKECSSYTLTVQGRAKHNEDSKISSPTSTYTVAALARYHVTYNANGGSGGPADNMGTNGCSTNDGKVYGKTFTLSSIEPTRTGYTFNGWNTNSSGTGTNYASGGSYTGNSELTVYAKWTANTYTIAFNKNGGTGTMSNLAMTYGTAKNLTANSFTKTGYSFVGWNTKADGTGDNYANGASVKNLTVTNGGTVTLYAKWAQKSSITVTADARGGTIQKTSSWTNSSDNKKATATVTPDYAYGVLPVATRLGYTFTGWYTASSGGTKITYDTIVTATANHTIYAQWKVNDLVFNNKNISVGYSDSAITKPVEAATNGSGTYTYSKKSGESNITVSSAGVITIPASKAVGNYTIVITAKDTNTNATKDATYTISVKSIYSVKFNANGGTGNMANQSFVYDEEKYLTKNTFTRTGYNFIGWNSKSDGTGTWYMPSKKQKNLTSTNNGTVNVYAQWVEPSDVSINVDVVDYDAVDDNGNYVFDNTPTVPYKIRYNANGGNEFLSDDHRLERQWEYEDGVWKSYDGLSWLDNPSSVESREFTLTSTDTLTFDWAVSGHVDNTFGSWTSVLFYTIIKDGETLSGTGRDTAISGNTDITSEEELTYNTISLELQPGTYKISFTYDAGFDMGENNGLNRGFVKNISFRNTSFRMPDQSYSANQSKALTKNTFYRPGYNFLGWSEDSGATTATYQDQEVVSNVGIVANQIVNLYAVWAPITEYNVSVNVVNGKVVGNATKLVNVGENGVFTIKPNTDYGYYDSSGKTVGTATCTNDHYASVSDSGTSVSIYAKNSSGNIGIVNETTCTITYKRVANFTLSNTQESISFKNRDVCCGATYSFDSNTGKATVNGTTYSHRLDATNSGANSMFGKYCLVLDSYIDNVTDGAACSATKKVETNDYGVYYANFFRIDGCTGDISTTDATACAGYSSNFGVTMYYLND